MSVDVHTFEKLRPVGLLERWSTYRHELGFYNNVACTALYKHPKDIQLNKATLYDALTTVLSEHSILFAIPVDEAAPSTYLARLPSIDLDRAVHFLSREDLTNEEVDKIAEDQHNTSFKENYGELPFWRLLVIENKSNPSNGVWISWVFHHALGDGGSGPVFHELLLATLNSANPGAANASTLVPAPSTPIKGPLEEYHKFPLSIPFIVKMIIKHFFPLPSFLTQKYFTGSPIIPPSRTRLKSLHIDSAVMGSFLAFCKQNKTTITCALEALFSRAILSVFPDFDAILLSTPIEARRWIPDVTPRDFGVYVTSTDESFSKAALQSPKDVWAEARRAKQNLAKVVSWGGTDTVIGTLRWVGDLQSFFEGRIGKERADGGEVSNVGVFDGQKEGSGWNVSKCIFSQSQSVNGAAIYCSAISVKKGPMCLAITWQEGVVGEDEMAKIVEKFNEYLVELLNDDVIDR